MRQKLKIEDVIAYFNRPITINEHNCWLWLGATDDRGYARFGMCSVHLWTLKQSGVENPSGTDSCHTCPHPNCINPDHFYIGTHQQNMNDENREVMGGPKGKLSQTQIEEINMMLKDGIPKGRIAKFYGISPQWISKFLKGGFSYAKPI